MNKKIDTILNDLYLIDPKFRKHEVALRKLVSDLLASQPDTRFDTAFATRLRAEVLERFEAEVVRPSAQSTPVVSPYVSSGFFSTHFFVLFRTWAPALVVLILLPFSYLGLKQLASEGVNTGFSVQQQISDKGTKAFGTLSVPSVAKNTSLTLLTPAPEVTPQMNVTTNEAGPVTYNSRTTFVAPTAALAPAFPGSSVSGMLEKQSSPQHSNSRTLSYVYKGVPLTLTDTTGKVYKRIIDRESATDFSSVIQNSNFGVINLNSFKNSKPQNIELSENTTHGYVINVDFVHGQISINPQWDMWKDVFNAQGQFVIPSDDMLIASSNEFLKEHGINTSLYTTPVVVHDAYNAAGTKVGAQDSVTVVYPITINGMTVYDENAQPYGLQVAVNIQTKKVVNVLNLTSQQYESASYDLITDAASLLRQATSSPLSGSAESLTVTLQTPQHILLKMWKTDNDGATTEFYIPALLFKAIDEHASTTPLQPVIVPLTKESFDTGTTSSSSIPSPVI